MPEPTDTIPGHFHVQHHWTVATPLLPRKEREPSQLAHVHTGTPPKGQDSSDVRDRADLPVPGGTDAKLHIAAVKLDGGAGSFGYHASPPT